MAKLEINWQINNFQNVLQAYESVKAKDKEISELAAANVRQRKAALDNLAASMKATSETEKKLTKQVYDEKVKLERQALKDFEQYQKHLQYKKEDELLGYKVKYSVRELKAAEYFLYDLCEYYGNLN
jgi:hypothetical protein